MRIDAGRLVPLGMDHEQELKWVRIGLVANTIYSLGYVIRLTDRYGRLFYTAPGIKMLIPDAVMPDFVEILGGSLAGFMIVALCMLPLMAYHYFYHYQGSRSIYLMKRLPKRFELARRCAALPLIMAAVSLLAAFVLLLIYFGLYMLVTPEPCLAPDQWLKIWNAF